MIYKYIVKVLHDLNISWNVIEDFTLETWLLILIFFIQHITIIIDYIILDCPLEIKSFPSESYINFFLFE